MHTQGPWKEDDKHTGGARAIIGNGQQLVALVYGKTAEECAANARLVAVGRELFDAVVDTVNLMDDTTKQNSGAYLAIKRLEAAIAKVTR